MRLSPVVGLAMVLAIACSSGPTAPGASPTAVPGTLTLSGSIVSNQDRVPIAGATFEVSQAAVPVAVTTDAAGQFAVGGLARGMVLVAVSAPGYLTHRTKVNITDSRTGFVLDLIPNTPPFDLEFYREFARGKFDGPMVETRRWTMNPSFYFQTVTADTGVPVKAAILDKLEQMFVAAVPELTAGMFRVAAFDRGPSAFAFTEGWVAVQFFEKEFNGGYAGDSFVGGNQGRIRLRENAELDAQHGHILSCESMSVRVADHEIVHAMGYRHTSSTFNDFQSGEGCPGKGRPARVRYHAAVMYSRQPGNTDVDTDRTSFAYPLASVMPGSRVSCGPDLFIR
jgi:hypothetical protein